MHSPNSPLSPIMLNQFGFLVILLIASATALPSSVPFKDKEPKLHSFGAEDWRKAYNESHNAVNSDATNERSQRLGYTTGYGNGLQGYPHSANGIGVYTPMKIDLGGVFLGALVGIGAILILPKLVNAFSGNYGNYRSIDGEPAGLGEMLAKLDTYLGQNNIDTASCMQRAVCTYVKSSEKNMRSGAADQIDQIIHDISRNSIVEYMLDGTPIKEALENGRSDRVAKCEILYPGCKLDQDSLLQMVKRFMPKN
ncbi:uncharacterized protein LOC132257903 [Phlebotomus argentipes]|uniref:uncharacterized protein LOC132257903 n=1 Tax=Phlebotomus argentipes TaxID=94469 RepID=UPI0028937EEB|nr:uncharacterized protein LOC132257903 [Phlebotomus argentipes]